MNAHGVVAHLGERIAGSDEVASSSLVVSTKASGNQKCSGSLSFCGFREDCDRIRNTQKQTFFDLTRSGRSEGLLQFHSSV